jgi:hypothetical protein
VIDRSEIDEPGAIAVRGLVGDRQGHGGLSDASRPGDRDETPPLQPAAHHGDDIGPADRSREATGQVMPLVPCTRFAAAPPRRRIARPAQQSDIPARHGDHIAFAASPLGEHAPQRGDLGTRFGGREGAPLSVALLRGRGGPSVLTFAGAYDSGSPFCGGRKPLGLSIMRRNRRCRNRGPGDARGSTAV